MKITLNNSEFANLVISFLYDKMLNPNDIVDEENFNNVIKDMKRKGMQPIFLQYYLKMDAEERLKYRRIKPSLKNESNEQNQIVLIGDKNNNKIKNKIFKKLIKRML